MINESEMLSILVSRLQEVHRYTVHFEAGKGGGALR